MEQIKITIPNDLVTTIINFSNCMSKDTPRYNIACVRVLIKDKTAQIVATDGHVLVKRTCACELEDKEYFFDIDDIKAFKACKILSTETTILYYPKDITYPDFDQVIPKQTNQVDQIVFNLNLMTNIAKAMKHMKLPSGKFIFNGPTCAARIEFDSEHMAVIMPIRI